MVVIESVDDLWNLIAYVLLYAPDSFPNEDFLNPEEQMTLDKAFEQLHAGVLIAYPERSYAQRRDELQKLLDRSYVAYRNGDEMLAVTLLNDFEARIFKQPT